MKESERDKGHLGKSMGNGVENTMYVESQRNLRKPPVLKEKRVLLQKLRNITSDACRGDAFFGGLSWRL